MRIIAGTAKGRQILAPKGKDTRPTLDRIKESLFGILQFKVADARVLDLFAGSGSLGLEALSRGADDVVFNDFDPKVAALVKKNLEALGFLKSAKVYSMDYAKLLAQLEGGQGFDIVFLDPPYQSPYALKAANMLLDKRLLNDAGVIVIEHGLSNVPEPVPNGLQLKDKRKYGEVHLSFLERIHP